MKWQKIREHYPKQWLLIEALQAHSIKDKRILDDLAVLGCYQDSMGAMKGYGQLHRKSPERELYVCHTTREFLDITERQWLGIRSVQ